jgi:hypothetical protein
VPRRSSIRLTREWTRPARPAPGSSGDRITLSISWKREVLADDVADASAHGDATGGGLGLQALVIGAIDAAVE